jgi:hypothetical protein
MDANSSSTRRGKGRSQAGLGGGGGVSAHGHILGLKPFLFSNLQITLNSTQI